MSILSMNILTLMWVSARLISVLSACMNYGINFWSAAQLSLANSSTMRSMHRLMFRMHSC